VVAIASKATALMAMRVIRLTATFRYFVGLHSRAIRCASAICVGVILAPPAAAAE
jgi:hypothetical protein